MPDRCFCELIRHGPISQPSNTWSSLAFLAVGLWIVARGFADKPGSERAAPNPLVARPVYSWLYGTAVVLIGLGSAFFHASLTFVGQWLDVMGMFLLITFVLLYSLSRFNIAVGEHFMATYTGSNCFLGAGLVGMPELRRYVFGGLVLAVLALELVLRRRRAFRRRISLLLGAISAFALGFAVWILDIQKVLCAPEGWAQGHAFWHLTGAVATALLYLYLRSEATPRRLSPA